MLQTKLDKHLLCLQEVRDDGGHPAGVIAIISFLEINIDLKKQFVIRQTDFQFINYFLAYYLHHDYLGSIYTIYRIASY